ncbi:MAG: hypothetical protein GY754_17490 [bacterium]|nr:hypothetical protein [bacterium]
MGTRAKIKIENKGRIICSRYYNMDGHVENWAPMLIIALNQTTSENILKNRQLFQFMFDDYESDDGLNYLCKVEVSDDDYHITIINYNKELLFEGTLDEFSKKYDEIY